MKPIGVMLFRREVPTGGGPETLISDISRFIDRDRFALHVAVFGRDADHCSPWIESLRANNTPVTVLTARHRFDRSCIKQLAGVLQDEQIDVLHTHDHRTNLIGYLASRKRPTRLAATLHQPMRRHWWIRHFEILDGYVVGRFDRILPVAEAIRIEAMTRRTAPPDKIVTVLNGVDLSRFDQPGDPATVRNELGLGPDVFLGATIGRLSDDKGFPYLLEGLQLALREKSDLYWMIAGRGPLEDVVRKKIQNMNLSKNVFMLGFRTDLPDLFAAADLLVIASTSEGCSVVALESMAAGCPIVATDVGGSAEIVVHQETGIVIEPRKPHQIADAILELAADPTRRANLALLGSERVRTKFSALRMVRQLEDIYEDLASLP